MWCEMQNRRSSTSIFRNLSRFLGAGVVGVISAAICIEIILRLCGYGAISYLGYGKLQNNLGLPELGYAGRPNLDGIQTREGYSHLVLNDFGFHDLKVERKKPQGFFRVAVLGNSLTMAAQVATSETYVSHLGKTLAACPALREKRVEAINLAVDGYTTAQNYLLMKKFVWTYLPDFIVFQESPGIDESEAEQVSAHVAIDDEGREHVDSSFMHSRNFLTRSSRAFTLFQKLSDHSRLLQYIDDFRRKKNARREPNGEKEKPSHLSTSARWMEKARLLKAIVETSRSHSTPLALVLIPDGESMDPREPNETPKTDDEMWWENQSRELGIPFINAATSAWNFARQHRVFLSGFGQQSGRGHLTRYGNAFFGREFANEICRLLTQREQDRS
jgi:DNA-binding transcriptional regulator YdaS (Cro superfamily)